MAGTPIVDIRQHLQTYGFTKWGFVIYRCTYDNNDAWNTFLHNFRTETNSNFADKGADGAALLSRLDWTIMEDRDRFDNASKATIRQAFQEWVDSTTQANEQPGSRFNPKETAEPRYRFCIQVDAEALRSLVPSALGALEDANDDTVGFVNLIKRRWPDRLFLPPHIRAQVERDEEDEVEDADDEEDRLPDIEGCTDEDVGFMRLDLRDVYPAAYHYLVAGSDWGLLYVRPPEVGPR